jgi:hypothetical protein
MSTAILCTDCPSILNSPNIGFGPEFEELKKYYDVIISEFRKAETLGRRLHEVLQSLDEAFRECSEEDWDGYGSLPITEEVYLEAKKLIRSLPLAYFMPMPEIVPEPDGSIGIEWSMGNRLIFVASVRGKNEIVYAGLFGMNRAHGIEYFGDYLPPAIIANLRRMYSICKDWGC